MGKPDDHHERSINTIQQYSSSIWSHYSSWHSRYSRRELSISLWEFPMLFPYLLKISFLSARLPRALRALGEILGSTESILLPRTNTARWLLFCCFKKHSSAPSSGEVSRLELSKRCNASGASEDRHRRRERGGKPSWVARFSLL